MAIVFNFPRDPVDGQEYYQGQYAFKYNFGQRRWLPIPYTDKFVHSVFYIVAALLWCNSFQFKSKFIKVFIICFSYGVLMEILQLYIFTSRSAEVADVVANSVGAIIGLILYRYTSLS